MAKLSHKVPPISDSITSLIPDLSNILDYPTTTKEIPWLLFVESGRIESDKPYTTVIVTEPEAFYSGNTPRLYNLADSEIESREDDYQSIYNTKILGKLSTNLAVRFNRQKKKFPELIKGLENEADSAFILVFERIKKYDLTKTKVNITESPSLFFVINTLNNFELKLEIFFGKDFYNVAYSLYHNGDLIARDYGGIDEIFYDLDELIILDYSTTSFTSSEGKSKKLLVSEQKILEIEYPSRLLPSIEKHKKFKHSDDCYLCRRSIEADKMYDEDGDIEVAALQIEELFSYSTNLVNHQSVNNIIELFPEDVLIIVDNTKLTRLWDFKEESIPKIEEIAAYQDFNLGYFFLQVKDLHIDTTFPFRKNQKKDEKNYKLLLKIEHKPTFVNIAHFEFECYSDFNGELKKVTPGNIKEDTYRHKIIHTLRAELLMLYKKAI